MPCGICKYCGKETKLCLAHIIPKSFYQIKEIGKYTIIDTDGNTDKKSGQNGIKDSNILCSNCDNILGNYDKYAKEILFDIIPKKRHIDAPLFLLNQENYKFDYKKLRFFFISLVWRASISETNDIKLGKYEDIALKILKGEIPDNPYLFYPIIARRTENYKNKEIAFIKQNIKYCGQKFSTFIFPHYCISIITNVEPIKNEFLIKKQFSFNEYEFPVFETDLDLFKIESCIDYVKSEYLKNK